MQTTNSIVAMRDVLAQGEAALCQSQRETIDAQARAERAEKALEVAQSEQAEELDGARYQTEAELECLKKQLGVAEATIDAQDLHIQSLGIEVKAAEERASNAEEIAQRSDARAAGMEETVCEVGEKASATEERAAIVEGRVAATEERVAATEEWVTAVEEQVAAAEERGSAAEEKAVAAEGRAASSEEKAATAIDDFQRSTSFAKELAEASIGVYLLSFRDGKEKVGRVHDLSGLDDLEPNEVSEGSTASPGPTGDGSRPTKA